MNIFKREKIRQQALGRTYYDPTINRVFTVHSIERNRAICGRACNYYGDARRQVIDPNPNLEPISLDYIDRCELIQTVDQCASLAYDGNGWRVRGY